MNILISSGIFPPDIGGPANFVPRIAHWLVQRGHTVQVVCWSDSATHEDDNYSFNVYRILRSGSRFMRLRYTAQALYKFGKSADVVFANGLDLEARIAATLLRKPELHKVVGDRAWEISRVRDWYSGTIDDYQQAQKTLKLNLLDKMRDLSFSRARLIVTPSYYLSKIVENWKTNHRPLQVIYNSTQLEQQAEAIDLPDWHGQTISTVCRLVPWKGVAQLINSLKELPSTRLVVAGDGPEKIQLEQHAKLSGVADRVIFLGQVPKAQVRGLLDASDIFILNSGYEGLPHVVLEAMAARVPVIATDVGGTSEVVKHNETGLLIPYGDDKALLTAISRILSEKDLHQSLVTNARRLIEQQFDEEACFLAYERALESLITEETNISHVQQKEQNL